MTDDDIITGSWCSGSTLRKDLLPPHIEAAKRILDWSKDREGVDQDEVERHSRELETIDRRQPDSSDHSYFEEEDSAHDLSTLDTILNNLAPEGYYWGGHEGDPTDVGYWRHS